MVLQGIGRALRVESLPLNLFPAPLGPLSLELLLLVFFPHVVGIGLDPIAFGIFAGIDSYKEKKNTLIKESGPAPKGSLR